MNYSSNNVSITTESLLCFAKQQEKNELLIEKYRKIVFAYVERCPANYISLPTELKEDKEILIHALSTINNYYNYSVKDFIPEKYRDDEQIMFVAILRNDLFFEQLSDRLKSDRDFMLAIPKFGNTIKYVPKYLLDDDFFVANQMNALSDVLWSVSERLQDNKELMLCAVKQYGKNLRHVSLRLRGDEDVVYAAVKNDQRVWSYADKEKIQDKYKTVEMFLAKYSFPPKN